MPRARSLKPGFFNNPELLELPFEYRILFAGLWSIADREGRLEDRPKKIKLHVFPGDDVDVELGLEALSLAGFISRYSHGKDRYIQVVSWAKHQSPHMKEAASTIPAPCLNGAKLSVAALTPDSGLRTPDSLFPITDTKSAYEVLESIKTKYPAGTFGAQNWILAEREISKLLDLGETSESLTAAAAAYREQMDAKGSVGTQYVRSPEKFYGGGFWKGPFPLPIEKPKKTGSDRLTWAPQE